MLSFEPSGSFLLNSPEALFVAMVLFELVFSKSFFFVNGGEIVSFSGARELEATPDI
jgi:hypothetical protein